jgi:site-specific recombinase XerD
MVQRRERGQEDPKREPGQLPPAWEAAVERLRQGMVLANRSRATVEAYCQTVQRFARFLVQEGYPAATPAQVTPDMVEAFLARSVRPRRQQRESGSRYSPHAARVALESTALRQFYRYLHQVEGIPVPFPAEGAFPPRPPSRGRDVRHLAPEDVRALVRAIRQGGGRDPYVAARDLALVGLILTTGLRISEALALQPQDLRSALASGWLRVVGKGGKVRELPVAPPQAQAMQACLQVRAACPYPGTDPDVLFPTRRRRQITVSMAEKALVRYARQAGLRYVTPHVLRHTFATHLAREGVPIEIVQELLGHANISTTRIYVSANARARRLAMEQALSATEDPPVPPPAHEAGPHGEP